MFFKSSDGFMLSNCLNAKKKKNKYIWNTKYTIQHRTECSQTAKCIQYNLQDTKSCELPNCLLTFDVKYREHKANTPTIVMETSVLRSLSVTNSSKIVVKSENS